MHVIPSVTPVVSLDAIPEVDGEDVIRALVERHCVRLSVYREYGPDDLWRPHPVGFDVELTARVVAPDPMLDRAAQSFAYEVLERVAKLAFADLKEYPRLTYEINPFDGHVIVEHGTGPVEIELAGHILHADNVRLELDDEERLGLERVRERLRSLGVRE